MRVAITNTVVLNGGDAAIALSLEAAIRRAMPDATIEIYEAQPDVACRYYPMLKFRRPMAQLMRPRLRGARRLGVVRRLEKSFHARRILWSARPRARLRARLLLSKTERAAVAHFAKTDVIVSTGGTYLVEQYPLEERLFEFALAEALGIPMIFYTQSLGPFMREHNRVQLRPIFENAALVLLRDQQSAQHLDDIGVDGGSVHVVSDAVFAMTSPDVEFRDRHIEGGRWQIGVSVRAWPPGATQDHPEVRRFVGEMAHGVSELIKVLPAEVTFVSTCQGIEEYWIDDSEVAEGIVALMDSNIQDYVTVDRVFHDPAGFRDITQRFDFVIATRMHAGILGLTGGTPVIPIAYEFKTNELFAKLGLADYVLDIAQFTARDFAANALTFVAKLGPARAGLEREVRSEFSSAEVGAQLLADALRRIAKGGAGGA